MLSPRNAGARSGERGLAASSVPLMGVYGGGADLSLPSGAAPGGSSAPTDQHLGKVRDKYMVLCLDSLDTVGRLGKLLARKGKVLTSLAAAGHSVGLAVCSAFPLHDTLELLQARGISPADLDFAVTSCGAEVWYCGDAAATKSSSSEGCVLDDAYDTKLDLNWDAVSVRRVLNQCMGQLLRQGAAATSTNQALAKVSVGSSSGLSRRSSLSLALPRCKILVQQAGAGHHLMVVLEAGGDGGFAGAAAAPAGDETTAPADAASAKQSQHPPLTAQELIQLISRIKRRLRRSGLRTQVIAQQDDGCTKLHILPLRGSRALALRHLTYHHRVDMSSLVLVTSAKEITTGAAGAAGVAKFACSDAEELVSGVQGVLVVPPAGGADAGGSVDGFAVDLELFTHDGRLQLMPGM